MVGTHPYAAQFDALTEAQRDVMGQLAVDNAMALTNKPVVRELVDLGLLATWEEIVPIPGKPAVTVTTQRYAMPFGTHAAWCQWCSEHLTDADRAEADL